jgi:acetylornithine deacetylase/succinyl-diaminopimelate desuccinylase-like protein
LKEPNAILKGKTMTNKQEMLSSIKNNLPKYQEDLMNLIRIPSVSTDPGFAKDVKRAANWLKEYLSEKGYQTTIFETPLHPMVFAESTDVNENEACQTILIYGHYDVQPSDPNELWTTKPFEPTIIGDELHARGASDMKGQFIAAAAAAEAFRMYYPGKVKIKFLLEGEEETGSPSMKKFLIEHKDMLKADLCLNPDAGMISREIPSITLGLRGMVDFELTVTGPDHDLHSGGYGGLIDNPVHVLSTIVGKLHDENGKIAIPGFYDNVIELSDDERDSINKNPTNENQVLQHTRVPKLWGEKGYSVPERTGIRPSLSVNGMYGGYTGEGSKTIIPSKATAKITIRLVKDQDPVRIEKLFREFLEKNMPETVTWHLNYRSGAKAAKTDANHSSNIALVKAIEEIWGIKPIYKMEGGSIPVVNHMEEIIGVKSILTGFGLADDRIHSPNEKLDLVSWSRGIEALALFFLYYCEQK